MNTPIAAATRRHPTKLLSAGSDQNAMRVNHRNRMYLSCTSASVLPRRHLADLHPARQEPLHNDRARTSRAWMGIDEMERARLWQRAVGGELGHLIGGHLRLTWK
eukprot:675097-Pleurochrysis_carterae.AAC.1